MEFNSARNGSNAELNPTCHLLALLGAHHILHVSRIRVKVFSAITRRKIPVETLRARNSVF